jgi:hypothetical protein
MRYLSKIILKIEYIHNILQPKISGISKLKPLCGHITRERADRLISLILVCIVLMVMVSNLNFALAVSVEGEFVGYVSSIEELETIVSDVNQNASNVLGRECDLSSELSYKVSVGSAENGIDETIENKLYNSIDEIDTLALICADGKAVCAYKTQAEAVEAIDTLKKRYINGNTLTADFKENISVVSGYGSKQLLNYQDELIEGKLLTIITTEKLTTEEPIMYETDYVLDDSMYSDESVTLTEGCYGVLSTDYNLTRVNGELKEYTKSDSIITVQPVKEVVKTGTMTRISTGTYIWPCDGYISCKFGYRGASIGSSYHSGIDIVGAKGDSVWAADGGVVIFSGWDGGYGNLVKIQHENGDVTYYAHNSKNLVSEGETVAQGQQIAEMGRTGIASANHCHFEIRPDGGSPTDPEKYLPKGVLKVILCG